MYKTESNGTQMISTFSTKERYVQGSAVLGRLQRHSSLKNGNEGKNWAVATLQIHTTN